MLVLVGRSDPFVASARRVAVGAPGCGCGKGLLVVYRAIGMTTSQPDESYSGSEWTADQWRKHVAEERTLLFPAIRKVSVEHGKVPASVETVLGDLEADHVVLLKDLDEGRPIDPGAVRKHADKEDALVRTYARKLLTYARKANVGSTGKMLEGIVIHPTWVKPTGTPSMLGIPLTPYSPNGSAWIVFISAPASDGAGNLYQAEGLDATNTWWAISPMFRNGTRVSLAPPGIVDSIADGFVRYVVPVLASTVAAAEPGIGTAFGRAILAWRELALGQSISDAVVNASRAKLASPLTLPAFDQGLNAIRSGLTEQQIADLSTRLVGGAIDKEVQQAFQTAVQLGRAQQTQDLTVSLVRPLFSDDEWNPIQQGLDHGAKLSDAVWAMGGEPALTVLKAASTTASEFVQANVQRPNDIAKAAASPASYGLSAYGGSGVQGQTGTGGVGKTMLVVGAVGALAWIGWKFL